MTHLFDLSGRVAVVTGGTGVLGSEMSIGLAKAGAPVAIIGRNKASGDNVVKIIEAAGGTARFYAADVLDESQLVAARAAILRDFSKIDILVNAAGGNLPGAIITPEQKFFDLDMDEFDRVVDLNLKGTVLPTKVFTYDMAVRRSGVVINIASMASIKPITRVVGYSAAKAAVDNFTKWLAVEMARKYGEGIRVNAIAPGFFITEQNRALLTHADGSYTPRGEQAIRQTPFSRFGNSEELTGTLIWLCADASKFVTGVTIPVDGGFSAFFGV